MDAEKGRPESESRNAPTRRRSTRAILAHASLASLLFLLFTFLAHLQLSSLLSLQLPTVVRAPGEISSGDLFKTELLSAVAVRGPCISLLSAFAVVFAASSLHLDRSKDGAVSFRDVVGAAGKGAQARWALLLLWFYHTIAFGSLVLFLFLVHMGLAGSAGTVVMLLPVLMLVLLALMSHLAGVTLVAVVEEDCSVKKSKAAVKRTDGWGAAAAWISMLCHGQFLAFELVWIAVVQWVLPSTSLFST